MTNGPDVNDSADAVTLACAYLDARNHRRAEEVLRSALTQDPHNPRLLTELARAQYSLGDHAAAEQSVRAALAITPRDAYPMRVYAGVLEALGRRAVALAWARDAVKADPRDLLTHYEYARLLVIAGMAADALPVATEALHLAPADADAHYLMGLVLAGLRRWEESTAQYQEALRLNPGHGEALHNIAVNHANTNSLPSALSGFREAAALNPHLGGIARRNIISTVRKWLAWMGVASWGTLYILYRVQERDGVASPAARIVAVMGCLALLVMFGWLARSLPRNIWESILRDYEFWPLKVDLALGVLVLVVFGALALGAPISSWVLLSVLLITFVVTWIVQRFDGG